MIIEPATFPFVRDIRNNSEKKPEGQQQQQQSTEWKVNYKIVHPGAHNFMLDQVFESNRPTNQQPTKKNTTELDLPNHLYRTSSSSSSLNGRRRLSHSIQSKSSLHWKMNGE
ncbi:hypothetical protein DERF_000494 [Dermatophagoides farinae]|uniref:Uncharacterized protein n=1 Tax=Dermatophagoides farinae TaxID=6954 RepID=A0A922I7H4_DERFA|nr:hypothetical protein DERF_000494 [Dermatophagoides farinae]